MFLFFFTDRVYYTVTMERDMVDISTALPQPDPNWTYTDRAGHAHWFVPDHGYVTLKRVVDRWGYDEDGERYAEVVHVECRKCREHIVPATIIDPYQRLAAGLRSWSVDVELPVDLTDSLAQDAMAAIKQSELCQFYFPQFEGQGYISSVRSSLDGPLYLTIHGTGPLFHTASPSTP